MGKNQERQVLQEPREMDFKEGVVRGPDTQKDTNELSDDFRRHAEQNREQEQTAESGGQAGRNGVKTAVQIVSIFWCRYVKSKKRKGLLC